MGFPAEAWDLWGQYCPRSAPGLTWHKGTEPETGSGKVMEPMLRTYPLGSQVLHGCVSLEESEQALGSGRCLLWKGALAATTLRGWVGGLL